MKLQGKTALVTGGTDGIGAQLIRQLRAKGVTVITSGRNGERVAATRADGFETVQCDLATLEGVEALLAGLGPRPIDILINNAGAGVDHDFRVAQPDLAAADATIFLNLNAPMHLIARLLPMLKTLPEALVVNITSGLAIAPRAGGQSIAPPRQRCEATPRHCDTSSKTPPCAFWRHCHRWSRPR